MASPQAVPMTRTTLRDAALIAGAAATRGAGGATSGEGPETWGSGSRRASAFRIGPDGGSSVFSSRRIAERWMSARSLLALGAWAATAARIHTMPRPSAALSAAPSSPSSSPRPGTISARRRRRPMPSSPLARIAPANSAPTRPKAGA